MDIPRLKSRVKVTHSNASWYLWLSVVVVAFKCPMFGLHYGITLGVYSHSTEYFRVVGTHASSIHSMFSFIWAMTQSWFPILLGWRGYQLDQDNTAPVVSQRNSPSWPRSLRPIQIFVLPVSVKNDYRKQILMGWVNAVWSSATSNLTLPRSIWIFYKGNPLC